MPSSPYCPFVDVRGTSYTCQMDGTRTMTWRVVGWNPYKAGTAVWLTEYEGGTRQASSAATFSTQNAAEKAAARHHTERTMALHWAPSTAENLDEVQSRAWRARAEKRTEPDDSW